MNVMKKILTLALTLSLLAASSSAVLANTPSPWAQQQVDAAIAENLVPQNLRSNFTQPITRAEFSALAVTLYERVAGEITGRVTFTDTNDANVEKMAYLGVVSGVGDNMFNPNATLTREQAAVMLSRLSDAINRPFASIRPGMSLPFADRTNVASWAYDSVFRVYTAGIMSGVGDNNFAPQQSYTREQSIVTMLRVFQTTIPSQGHLGAPPLDPNDFPPVPGGTPAPTDDLPVTSILEVPDGQHNFEVGNVVVIANGVTHQPFVHFDHGAASAFGQLMSVSGLNLSYEAVWPSLPIIQATEDLEIAVYGIYANLNRVALYNNSFELIIEDESAFLIPEEPGEYLLVISVIWRNNQNQIGFESYRYLFRIRVA